MEKKYVAEFCVSDLRMYYKFTWKLPVYLHLYVVPL